MFFVLVGIRFRFLVLGRAGGGKLVAFDIDVKVDIIVVRFQKLDLLRAFAQDLDIQAQALQFLNEHLEGFRHARFRDVFTLHDCFIGLDTTHNVVGLDGQDLL